jgi:hypothetical protein
MVVDTRGREVDRGIEKLGDKGAERVGLRERWQLVAKLEILEDVLDVRREPVQVVLKIGEKLLLAAA